MKKYENEKQILINGGKETRNSKKCIIFLHSLVTG